MAQAPRDPNFIPVLQGASNDNNRTPTDLWVDPSTHRLLVDTSITLDNVDIPASSETSTIFNGTTALFPQFAIIDASSNGDNTIIAAITGPNKRIRILNGLLMASAAVSVYFRDGAAGTKISGTLPAGSNGGFQIPYSPIGNFQTTAGNALVLNLSSGIAVGGWVTYLAI